MLPVPWHSAKEVVYIFLSCNTGSSFTVLFELNEGMIPGNTATSFTFTGFLGELEMQCNL